MVKKNHYIDAVVITGLLLFAPALSILLEAPLLLSIAFFYGFPAIWLSFRYPKLISKAAVISFWGTLIFILVDFVATVSGSWSVASVFDFRIFDILPVENSLFFFFGVYLAVMFYEYFDDTEPRRKYKTRIKSLAFLSLIIFGAFILIWLVNPFLLDIPYAYAWITLIFALLPGAAALVRYKPLRHKFLRANLYIAVLNFLFELTALYLKQWSFPGKYFIGWISLGNLSFPVEEFIFYIAITGIGMLTWYEFFYDDQR